jgi:hypothetical protein
MNAVFTLASFTIDSKAKCVSLMAITKVRKKELRSEKRGKTLSDSERE